MPRPPRLALGVTALAGAALLGFAPVETLAAPGAATLATAQPRKAGWAELRYAIVDADLGIAVPGKLTFVGVDGTRTPRLGPRAGKRDGEAFVAFNRAFSASGTGAIAVPMGTYDVYASVGIEWTMKRTRVQVTAAGAQLEARLRRVVDTSGWLSADLHVHSSWSRDSVVPPAARVQQFLADGVELIVAAEHNRLGDYDPVITDLGARHLLASVRGIEITTRKWGHLGIFPLPADVRLTSSDVSRLKRSRTGAALLRQLRAFAPNATITVCHPHITTNSYIKRGGYSHHRDAAEPGFSLDFDTIEVLNGYHRMNFGRAIDSNLRRWFGLLDHGHLVAATGSSDSHGLGTKGGQGGYPRTYVALADDRPESASADGIADTVRSLRALFTTGPFVRVRIADKTIGDVAAVPTGRARLEIEVQAAPWVSADRVRVYVNGSVQTDFRIPRSQDVVRFRGQREIETTRDGYVVVRVDGKRTLRPIAGAVEHDIPSVAVTNPIFLDVDGNGRYDQRKPHGKH